MKYDFTSIIDRRGMDSVAAEKIPVDGACIEEGFSRIPMWIADMNFAVPPVIQEKMISRIQHPTFGYHITREEYYDAIMEWHQRRNGVTGLAKEDIGYENGVMGCLASVLQTFTAPGEAVLAHSPTYTGFTRVLKDNGRELVLSPLIRDIDGIYRMDYEDMDRKIKENHIHFVIFCSPHNPAGRVWSREEITEFMSVCQANDCVVFSDEIWSDLILQGYRHIPAQSVSEDARNRTIAVYSMTKTFNLAGLVGSYHIIYNSYLRDRVEKQSKLGHYNNMNILSMYALIGAYSSQGNEWVDELLQVLTENVNYACDYIRSNFPGIRVSKPQGTYMLYLDCGEWCKDHGKSLDELLRDGIRVGVLWQDGRPFYQPDTIRMNLALPLSMLQDAFARLDKYVFHKT